MIPFARRHLLSLALLSSAALVLPLSCHHLHRLGAEAACAAELRRLDEAALEEKRQAVEDAYGPAGQGGDPAQRGRLSQRFAAIEARYARLRQECLLRHGLPE
jgi:hypothetical protein